LEFAENALKRRASQVRHAKRLPVRPRLVFVDGIDRDDIGMPKLRQGLAFATDIGGDFQGDEPVADGRLFREINAAESSGAEFADKVKAEEPVADSRKMNVGRE
jgi:hypothetical protein